MAKEDSSPFGRFQRGRELKERGRGEGRKKKTGTGEGRRERKGIRKSERETLRLCQGYDI